MKTSNDFETIAKKSKRKNWARLLIVSVATSVIVVGGIYYSLEKIASRNGEKVMKYYTTLAEIAYPNIDYSSWGYHTTSPFSGQFYSNRVKDIDGITVPFEKYNGSYSVILNTVFNQDERANIEDGGQSAYTYGNHYKVPIFYGTRTTENEVFDITQDLTFIPDMEGKAVEVAITFDKPYTLAEIEKKIPQNLKLNWIWIGQYAPLYLDRHLGNQFGFTPHFESGLNAEEYHAMEEELSTVKDDADRSAIYAKYDKKVTPLEGMKNSYSIFQDNVQKFLDTGYGFDAISSKDGKRYATDEFLKDYLATNSDPETAKFAGVILTGRAENFEQLKDVDWIYASNIGQSVEIQPYHQLEK